MRIKSKKKSRGLKQTSRRSRNIGQRGIVSPNDCMLGPLSAHDIERIFEITKVPKEFRLIREIRLGIDIAVHQLATYETKKRDTHRERLKAAAYDRLRSLSEELCTAINDTVRQFGNDILLDFDATGLGERDEDLNVFDFVYTVDEFSEHCEQMTAINRRRRPANRPQGTFQYPRFHDFVLELYKLVVIEGHGELTVWQNDEGALRGTLPSVLDFLRPRLPRKVPSNLSKSDLRRLISKAAEENVPSKKY